MIELDRITVEIDGISYLLFTLEQLSWFNNKFFPLHLPNYLSILVTSRGILLNDWKGSS